MSETQNAVVVQDKKTSLSDRLIVGGTVALLSVPALAEVPAAPDVSEVVTYIGYAVAAVVAIGSAKLIPAAAMWLYSSLTSSVKRG